MYVYTSEARNAGGGSKGHKGPAHICGGGIYPTSVVGMRGEVMWGRLKYHYTSHPSLAAACIDSCAILMALTTSCVRHLEN